MATFTATEINPLKGLHVGENIVRSRFTGSLTVSEVLLLARIPNHALVTDWYISGGMTGQTTGTWKIGCPAVPAVIDAIRGISITENSLHAGISLTSSGFGGAFLGNAEVSLSASVAAGGRPPAIMPFKVSLSDDVIPQYIWIAGVFSGSQTGTHSINFLVKYLMGEG